MNKKIKAIELLNEIANGEDIPAKIKCKGKVFYFNKYEKSIDFLYRTDKNGNGWLVVQDIELTDEVEILEDNTEEIEELYIEKIYNTAVPVFIKESFELCQNKINELIKVINEIRKDKNND